MKLVRSRCGLVVNGGSSISGKAGISYEQTFRARFGPVPLNYTELAERY